MHLKQKLTFMAFGSILTIAGYLLATLTSDVTAQPKTDKPEPLIVDEIVCRKLRVVDPNDKTRVFIGADFSGGYMFVKNADGKNAVSIGTRIGASGYMNVKNADGQNVVEIGAFRDSGYMKVNRADGEMAVVIGSNDARNGGMVSVHGKSKGGAQLSVNEYGGWLGIFGNTDDTTRVAIGITERGHGTINTWDKGGYRTRP